MSDQPDNDILAALGRIEREMRLLRLQVDNLAGTVPPRLAVIEQSFHDLTNETARGFGQMQQGLTRHEKRFDGLDAALAKLGTDLAESTERIMVSLTTLLARSR